MDSSDLYSKREDLELKGETLEVDLAVSAGSEVGTIEEVKTPETEQLITGRSVGAEIDNSPIDLGDDVIIYDSENKIDFQEYALKNIKDAEDEQDAVTLKQLNEFEPEIEDGSITTDKLANGAVTSDKIASGAVTSDKIASGGVETGNIADEAVTTAKIVDGAITSSKIDFTSLPQLKSVTLGEVTTTGLGNVLTDLLIAKTAPIVAYTDDTSVFGVFYADSGVTTWRLHLSNVTNGTPKANTTVTGVKIYYLESPTNL